MPTYLCPHCQQSFTAPISSESSQVSCPHCEKAVEVPATPASRWFRAHRKKKSGPYTWKQLLTLAQRGDVRPDDMMLQEGSQRWVKAATLPALFAESVPIAKAASQSPKSSEKPRWLVPSLVGVGLCAVLAVTVSAAVIYFRTPPNIETRLVEEGQENEEPKKKPSDVAVVNQKKKDDPPKKDAPKEEKKKHVDPPGKSTSDQFVERLNRHRKAAGLGLVTLDAELSKGCQAHAEYLVKNIDPAKATGAEVQSQDPKKPRASDEGHRAAQVAMVATMDADAALERWMGRLLSRLPLLSPEMQSIGVGSASSKDVAYCVIDTQRGKGEPIVVYPAPKQTDVPIAFTGGPEAPENSPIGLPISVAFPLSKVAADAQIALFDAKGAKIEGTVWTPDKRVTPEAKTNVLAFLPKTALQGNAVYQVKASAQLDGKPWSLAWSFMTEDDVDSKGVWAKKALAKVNAYRAAAGLKPVTLDPKLGVGCLKHAQYLVLNEGNAALQGLNAHHEDPKLPGYTEEGAKTGPMSDIGIGDYEPIDAIDGWMATFYHRVPILAPNLKSIGFGCAKGRRQGWATVMNLQSGRDQSPVHPVFYPALDQIGIPLNFPNSGEEPNPIPDDPDRRAGFSVTAILPRDTPLVGASGKLTTSQGEEVPCWFSAPDKPANVKHAKQQGNVACLIAKDPLKPKTTYHVQFQGKLAGKAWEKKWQFTTADDRPVPDAVQEMLARVNHFRAQAGLAAVTLDETQSRGCQLHAEFLAKNAGALEKRKAPVNDEDPLLPGFTAEGQRTARQSRVFTNAPTPVMQIDDLMGSFVTRLSVLDPNLQRVGIGCAHDVGKGWRCVFDPLGGRGDARVLLYPAPNQTDIPMVGHDRGEATKGAMGFPIGVTFPRNATVRKADAVLTDAKQNFVPVAITSPEKPIHANLQSTTVGVHPIEPLLAGKTYTVTVSAIVDGKEWRQSWQFTTAK